MTTYKELQSQIERLQQEAELARKTELANAITEIIAKMREYGLSPHDLGFSGATKRKAVKAIRRPVAPKYRNNATGETWSGRGKPPKWMAGRDKSQFLIHSA
jgi:DNA-binding protein H-NS